jgi:adenine phosphoribosyltransferase
MSLQEISNCISVIPNYPKEGIFFRNLSPLLANYELRESACDKMYDLVKDLKIDYVAGIESRGQRFESALAQRLKCGLVILRKASIEHGKNVLTIEPNVIPTGKNVLIVDDILATGGSLVAGCALMEKIGCTVSGCLCLIELVGVLQKEKLSDYKVFSLLKYPSNSTDKYAFKEKT